METLNLRPGNLERRATPPLSANHVRLLCWGFAVLLLVAPTWANLKHLIGTGQSAGEVNFVYFYSMGRMFNQYPADQLYDFELQKKVTTAIHAPTAGAYGPNPYAPFLGVLFRPFALMPFLPAFVLWFIVSLSLYVAGLACLTRHFFPDDPLRRSLIFCFALSFYPLFYGLSGGRVSTICFFAVAFALREAERQRPVWSGLALSLCLYKPSMLLLVVPMLLMTRRYQTLASFAGGGAALALFATIMQGPAVWPGYLRGLISFGSQAAQAQSFKVLWLYVDLASFTALLPGGRSWFGGTLLFGCAALAGLSLVWFWWKSRGAGKPVTSLIWAATLTWTVVLNLYVPIHDSILIVPSAIATSAVLKDVSLAGLRRQFTLLWILIFGVSWFSIQIAQSTGVQVMTILYMLFGTLQFAALRKLSQQQAARVRRSVPSAVVLSPTPGAAGSSDSSWAPSAGND